MNAPTMPAPIARAPIYIRVSSELALAEFMQMREREARTPGSFGDVGQALAMLGRPR